jgi:hypothetical protein
LDIDADLLAEAQQATAQIRKSLAAGVEDSLKLFLNKEKRVLQAPLGGYHGGSLDRDDPFSPSSRRLKERQRPSAARAGRVRDRASGW